MARYNSKQRDQILDAAIQIFAEQGLKGAAIRLVGRKAGVNSALIYYYFENKDTLFVEAIRRVVGGLIHHLREHQTDFTTAQERLDFLVDAVLDYCNAHPERMKLMAIAICLHAQLVAKVIEDLIQEGSLLPIAILQEGLARGELREVHPVQAWWSILGMCIFSILMRGIIKHVPSGSSVLPSPELAEGRRQIKELLSAGLIRTPAQKH